MIVVNASVGGWIIYTIIGAVLAWCAAIVVKAWWDERNKGVVR